MSPIVKFALDLAATLFILAVTTGVFALGFTLF